MTAEQAATAADDLAGQPGLESVQKPLRIGIIAGEASGDILGAGLMESILKRHPTATFEGLAGPLMIRAGCWPIYHSEVIAVMGLFEVLKHLPRILKVRRNLLDQFLANPPDVVIGIDSPDFNLGVEEKLRAAGIPTVHYVSPSVWAWRQKRVFKIARAVDLMLALFPFEAKFYKDHDVPVVCVGHPLAELIPHQIDVKPLRERFGLDASRPVLALLPGSRSGEMQKLGPLFAETLPKIAAQHPDTQFIAPMANPRLRAQFTGQLEAAGVTVDVKLIDGQSRDVMAAADAVLLASGTATLEATLLKRPMVVAYKLASLTYWLVKLTGIIKVEKIALPNLLSGKDLAPEYVQGEANPENLASAASTALYDEAHRQQVTAEFEAIHRDLERNASEVAAESVLKLIGRDVS